MINRKFSTYTRKDPEFYEDLLQAGRMGIILSLPKYVPDKSMPTTYFFPAIIHEMTALTNGMKHDAKSRIATLKRKMQEVDKKFEGYDRTPSLHDYAYNMGKSFNCITDALAQIKASDARISMDDPDAASFMDMTADINGPEETVASELCFTRLIQIAREIEPDEAIVCCFLEASKGPTETTWLAEKYHRSPSGITAGILNLKNALKCHEGIRELYPEFFQGKGKIRIPSRTSMEKADLCHLYDAVYSGRSDSILYEVSRNRLSDSDIGFLCRYVCEHYLHWGSEETMQKLSRMVLQTMKLDNLVEEMKLPPEISLPKKKMYLYCLMYPEYFGRYPKESFVTALYPSAISGHGKKLPRCFLSGSYGAEQNVRICLMYDQYDMKEQMKEISETKGGKAFFNELNAAGIPFFFIPATENTEDKTNYLCETITPSAMGIRLTDDKFSDHLNIQHQGVVTVLESPTLAPEVKGQNPAEETGTRISSVRPAGKGSVAGKSGKVAVSELLNIAIKNVILEQVSGQEQPEDVVPALDPGHEQYGEEISIVWGTKPLEPTKGSGQDRNTRN